MTHRIPTDRTIAVWVLLGVVGLVGISPAPVRAQVSAEESAKRLKPAAGPGGHPLGVRAAGRATRRTSTSIPAAGSGSPRGSTTGSPAAATGGSTAVDEADRIKILEDTDGDGKADKVTVFADQIFPVPMGIAVEEHYGKDGKYTGCRVFVGNSPDLLVLEDTDGDDKADKRYPLLTGFGGDRLRPRRPRHGARPRRQALLHPRRRLLLGPARPLRAAAELRRHRQERPARLDRPACQHPAGQPRRHRVRDHLRPPAEQLRDLPELVRQHLHQRQRRRRQPRLPGDLGDGRRPLRLPHAGQPPALGRGGAGQRPQARRHRQRQPVRHHGLRGRSAARRVSRRASSKPTPAPGRSTSSRSLARGRVPDRLQGLPGAATTRGSGPST